MSSVELRLFEYSVSKEINLEKKCSDIYETRSLFNLSRPVVIRDPFDGDYIRVASETIKLPIAYVASGGAPYQDPNEEACPLPIVCMITRWNRVIYICTYLFLASDSFGGKYLVYPALVKVRHDI